MHHAPQNRQIPAHLRLADKHQRTSLPVRSPGTHLHPVLRHSPAHGGWRDAQGSPVGLFCWVEQVTESTEPTVLPSRLHQHGQVVGRNLESLLVRFSNHQVISLRPDLVRVLDEKPGEC